MADNCVSKTSVNQWTTGYSLGSKVRCAPGFVQRLKNLGGREFQLSATTDRLGFLQFLNLGLASRNEFGLVGCFVLSFLLTLSLLSFRLLPHLIRTSPPQSVQCLPQHRPTTRATAERSSRPPAPVQLCIPWATTSPHHTTTSIHANRLPRYRCARRPGLKNAPKAVLLNSD